MAMDNLREYEVVTKEGERLIVDVEVLSVHSHFFRALKDSQMVETERRSVACFQEAPVKKILQ